MLVVDRVVLPSLDEAHQVRELQRYRALVFDECAQASGETPDVGNVSENVVGDHMIRLAVPCRYLLTGVRAEELDLRPDTTGTGRLRHVLGWIDAKHCHPRRLLVLNHLAVLA